MLIEPLLAFAASQPDQTAVIDEQGRHSYRDVAAMAAHLSRKISAATQRSNVGLLLPSSVGFVASFYGTLWAGKSVVPINFLLSQKEIAHILADSGIDTVITLPILAAKLKDTPLKIIDLATLKADATDGAETANPASSALPPIPPRNPDDMAVLMYTSGTSGLPKGVVLSFGNLQSDVESAIAHAQMKHGHIFLGIIPLFHSFGMTGTILAPMHLGATAIYMARFNATATVKAIREHGVSIVLAIPSMYGAMLHLKEPTADDFQSVYACISGGEPLPAAVREGFYNRFKRHIYEGYGLTETSPVVALNIPVSHRAGSVGIPVPGVRVRIVADDDSNQPTDQPTGESGEVWLWGPMVAKGYFHLPTETAASFTPDGFFKTGDMGRLDSDGFLYIVGRKKELIIVAGEKAAPREIEEALLSGGLITEAAVVGKKDPARGEVIVAFVLPKDGAIVTPDALKQTCRDAGLPQWKIPREIFIEQELPRSATGKVLKRMLKERVNA